MTNSWDLLVRRDDLRQLDVLPAPLPEPAALAPGELLVAVELISLTANNVTYGALGEDFGYWGFYPAAQGWGRIPAWGYARVTGSAVDGIEVGQRVFGYLPMSTHTILRTDGARDGGFTESSPYRVPLPAVYNRYRLVGAGADPDREARVALFMPLYGTSWLLADMLDDHGFFGARQVLVSAASSKTALGLGHALQRDFPSQVETIGLTSAGNRDFTRSTEHWGRVLTYDELGTVDTGIPTVYVDIAGNASLRRRVHEHLGDSLVASVAVGLADWESTSADPADPALPGPRPQLFFAPTRVEKRNADWGAAGLAKRLSTSQDAFAERSAGWLTIQEGSGPDAIREALVALLEGAVPPDTGIVVRP